MDCIQNCCFCKCGAGFISSKVWQCLADVTRVLSTPGGTAKTQCVPCCGGLWGLGMQKRVIPVVVALLCSIGFFFREIFLNRFDLFFGDSYDAMIELAILQHWYNVFAHREAFFTMQYFYPHTGTIGFNDSLIIPGVFFAASRSLGFDIFMSALVAHIAMKVIGFLGMFVLLRFGGAVRFWLALAGSVLFAIANASLLHMYHAQLLSVCLVPWLMFLALKAGHALLAGDRGKLCWWGGALGTAFGLSAFNAFYMIWFFAFGALIYLSVALATFWPQARRELRAALISQWKALTFCLIISFFALVPLGIAYIPKAMAGVHHDWFSGPADTIVNVDTLINVGAGNLVWGHLLELVASRSEHGLAGGEARFGIPLGLLVVGLFSLRWFDRNREGNAVPYVVGMALAILVALMWKWPGGFTGWYYVHKFVPGASVIRVVARGLLFALVPLIFIAFTYLDRSGRSNVLLGCLVAFLLIEQVQLNAPINLNRHKQQQMLSAAGSPPSDCQAIFVISARADEAAERVENAKITASWAMYKEDIARLNSDIRINYLRYRHNIDAMVLSEYYQIPTINGYSSFNPADWDFENSKDPSYTRRVANYAKAHGLTKLCGLDVGRPQRWFLLETI